MSVNRIGRLLSRGFAVLLIALGAAQVFAENSIPADVKLAVDGANSAIAQAKSEAQKCISSGNITHSGVRGVKGIVRNCAVGKGALATVAVDGEKNSEGDGFEVK